MITRRQLLSIGAFGGASLLLPRNLVSQMGGGMMGGGMMGGGMMSGGSPATKAFQVPLPIPALLKPTLFSDPATGITYDYYEVHAKTAMQQFIPGLWTEIWGYNGTFPGPAIKATSGGRPTWLRMYNDLPEAIVTHLHGGHVPVEMDGHAMDYSYPGSYRDYLYPNKQPGATIWFHDHTMGRTAEHVIRGLAGFYIIEDQYDLSLPLPKGAQDIAIVIQDRLFNADGSFSYNLSPMTVMHGYTGDVLLVNGAVQPYFKVANRKYRVRILNGSNARQYQLALSTGQSFVQIGSDGGLLPAPVTRSSILIAPGERVEVVIDFASYKVGTQVVLKNQLGSSRTIDIMRFDVNRKETETASVPKTLRPIIRIPEANASKTRTFTLGMTGGMSGGGMMGGGTGGGMGSMQFTINGLSYDHMHVEADPCLGSTEIWEFVNPMMMDHPMHAHAGMYQILDRNGVRPPAWEMGWKDVWLVRAGEKVRVIGTFNDYACDPDMMADLSNYMIHCHILEHDDNGMMTQFKVMPM